MDRLGIRYPYDRRGGFPYVLTSDFLITAEQGTIVTEFPDPYKLIGQGKVFKVYSFPKSYVSYCKPKAVSTEQREWARQMMIAKNKAKGV